MQEQLEDLVAVALEVDLVDSAQRQPKGRRAQEQVPSASEASEAQQERQAEDSAAVGLEEADLLDLVQEQLEDLVEVALEGNLVYSAPLL